MIRESGCVIRIAGSFAWVSCESRAGCERCAQGKGCGGGLLSRLLGDRLYQLRVPVPAGIAVGDQVQLGITEGALLGAACLMYLLPLLALLGGALIGDFLGGDELHVFPASEGLFRLLDSTGCRGPVALASRPRRCWCS